MSAPYPHLVVRIFSAVYQRESIAIHRGTPDVHIGFRSSYVRYPEPFTEDGDISPGCKDLLVSGVIAEVRRSGFRMCLVWSPSACTYCEKSGSAKDSQILPSGGLGSGGIGGRPLPIDVQFDQPPQPLTDRSTP